MMLKNYFIYVYNILFYCFYSVDGHLASAPPESREIQMISDVVKLSDKPTFIVANLCWKRSKKIRLMSSLMTGNNPKTICFVKTNWTNQELMRQEQVMFLTDLKCSHSNEFLQKAEVSKLFRFPYRWLIIGKSVKENKLVSSEILNLNILADSEVIIAQRNALDSYILKMVYKMSVNGKWKTENFGNWTLNTGVIKSKFVEATTSSRRKNFYGEPIKSAVVILDNKTKSDPYDISDIFTDTVTKSSIRAIDPIYEYLNASRHFIFTETWGYNKNGTYGGMVAELTVGDAELGGTVLITTKDRMEVVDYIVCPTSIFIKFVFRQPSLSYQNNLFLLPFKSNVWYCIGAFVLVSTLFIYINALWETWKQREKVPLNAIDATPLKAKFSEILILVIGAITQQGSFTELKGTLGRFVMFLLFWAFLLLYFAYSANIVALLQSSSNQIRTLSDLLNSKLELGVEDTPYNRYFFEIATEPVRKAIYQTKVAPPGAQPKFLSLEDGVKNLQTKPYAFNMNLGIGYWLVEKYFQEHQKCGFQEISYLDNTKTYTTCRKNSPYKEIFKVGLYRLKEHGLCDRENRLIYARKPACRSRGGSFTSVNMVDICPVLLMYFYGIVLSFAFLFLEIMVHRKYEYKIMENVLEI